MTYGNVNPLSAYAAVTGPGVQNLVNLAPSVSPYEQYELRIQFYIDGTVVAGTDEDNIKVVNGGNGFSQQLVYPVLATPYLATYVIPAFRPGPTAPRIQVATVQAASAAAVYHVSLTAIPLVLEGQPVPGT